MEESFLAVQHASKQYAEHVALSDINVEVPRGTIYGLLGPNGAGKTTLIRIITGITAPDSGQVLFDGHALQPADIRAMGYLPEERGLYRKMKVGEQALFLAQLKGMSRADALRELKIWFEKWEIQAWWNKKVEELSKGMAQKVQFITTVLHNPKLVILDEPFSGFDPVNAESIKQEILSLRNAGTTFIISTHNMASVEELCQNISLINQAHVVLQGNVSEIRQQYATNRYHLKTKNELPDAPNIPLRTLQNGLWNYEIVKPANQTNNQFLQTLMGQCEIVSFEEILPSMNDVFIQTVEK